MGVTEDVDGVDAGSGAGAVLTDSVDFLADAFATGFVSGAFVAEIFGSGSGADPGTDAGAGLLRPESGAENAGGSATLGAAGTEEGTAGGGVGAFGSSFSQARSPMAKAARMK